VRVLSREGETMSRKVLLGVLAIIAWMIASGCGMFKKESYLVPAKGGWVEMQSKDGGNKLKYKPAEKVEVEYK
jgi:hypothetical protein